jgi:hypothetical protein
MVLLEMLKQQGPGDQEAPEKPALARVTIRSGFTRGVICKAVGSHRSGGVKAGPMGTVGVGYRGRLA